MRCMQESRAQALLESSVAFFEARVENRAYASIDRSVCRSRVTRLARPGSKYKYVILAEAKGHASRNICRGRVAPGSCPKEHRLKRRVLWDKEKVWRTGSCRSRWRRAHPSVSQERARSPKVASSRWNRGFIIRDRVLDPRCTPTLIEGTCRL